MKMDNTVTDPVVSLITGALQILEDRGHLVDMKIRCVANRKGMMPIIQVELPAYGNVFYIHKTDTDTAETLAEKISKGVTERLSDSYVGKYGEFVETLYAEEQKIRERFTLKGRLKRLAKRAVEKILRWCND